MSKNVNCDWPWSHDFYRGSVLCETDYVLNVRKRLEAKIIETEVKCSKCAGSHLTARRGTASAAYRQRGREGITRPSGPSRTAFDLRTHPWPQRCRGQRGHN